mmetsp:Transcript_27369/g.70484  ORF Transcript_27369/g.70484 Transcript_27369/m.70484 type:complete len:444 (-) Transcript_27369:618-1949(-)
MMLKTHHSNIPRVSGRAGPQLKKSSRVPLVVRAVASPIDFNNNKRKTDSRPSVVRRDADGSRLFVDKEGQVTKAMAADYGFRAGAGRLYEEHYGEVPSSVIELATQNFTHELAQMRRAFRFRPHLDQVLQKSPPKTALGKLNFDIAERIRSGLSNLDESLEGVGVLPKLDPPPPLSQAQLAEFDVIQEKLSRLTLDNDAVARVEKERNQRYGELYSPLFVKLPFDALCLVLDVVYINRPIQKFWVLETVARIPYFACISILHLYESLGFWRAGAELRKIHFFEEWNELHHLQIMESLGGDQAWFDRFLAEHAAVLYYWVCIGFYLVSPKNAYNFMQRVEHHAADTYTEFIEENRELLASIPPPMVALNYYRNEDLYLFDSFQTCDSEAATECLVRRPACNNLLDVFINIRDDEDEHVKTMKACQNESIARDLAKGRGQPIELE